MSDNLIGSTRRVFFERTAAVLAGGSAFASLARAVDVAAATGVQPLDRIAKYCSLSADEAAFTEKLVNVLCPADDLTPNGVDCGLAEIVDQHLAHESGKAKFFKAGINAANLVSQESFGVPFDQLNATNASGFLRDVAGGLVSSSHLPLSAWLEEIVNPLLIRASFAGSIYETYCNRVFWKLSAPLSHG